MIDDVNGLRLAHAKGVHTIKTTHLVAEMVAASKLTESEGRPIFLSVRKRLNETNYQRALGLYRAAFAEATAA